MKETGKCRITVEVASNHVGDIELAKEFIRVCSEIGVDCVKFQSSRFEDLKKIDDPQLEWIRKTSLSDKSHYLLIDHCKECNIQFLTTCFSRTRIDFLASLGLDEIKLASPDLLSFGMIRELSEKFGHLIISTGMHAVSELESAIQFLEREKINATLLHSVSLYPTPVDKAWMNKFFWLREHYPRVGYSNHVADVDVVKFAMDNNAEIIEVHMKLGGSGPGRASDWDLLPEEVEEIVEYREKLTAMSGPSIEGNEDWLDEGEAKAAKRFIGRWGDNK